MSRFSLLSVSAVLLAFVFAFSWDRVSSRFEDDSIGGEGQSADRLVEAVLAETEESSVLVRWSQLSARESFNQFVSAEAKLRLGKTIPLERRFVRANGGDLIVRHLVGVENPFGRVVVDVAFDGLSGLKGGIVRSETIYVANHVLAYVPEGRKRIVDTLPESIYTSIEQVPDSHFFRIVLATADIGSVADALRQSASLGKVEPDFLVFPCDLYNQPAIALDSSPERVLDPIGQRFVPVDGSSSMSGSGLRTLETGGFDPDLKSGERVLTFDPPLGRIGSFRPEVLMHNFVVSTGADSMYSGVTVQDAYNYGYPDNGSNYLRVLESDESVSFAHREGLPFRANSIDLSEYSTVFDSPKTVLITGYKAEGSTVSQTFVTDGVIDGTGALSDFETFAFGEDFGDLIRLEVKSYPVQLDNVSLTIDGLELPPPPVPELPLLYDVDWNGAPHEVGKPSRVGGAFAISSNPFGGSLVRESLAALQDRPLELTSLRPNGDVEPYGQVRFDLEEGADSYACEFDMSKTGGALLAVFLDGEGGLMRFDFRSSVSLYASPANGANQFKNYEYDEGALNRFRIELDLQEGTLVFGLNGIELYRGESGWNCGDLKQIRFSSSDYGSGGVGLDNVKIYGYGLGETLVAGKRALVSPVEGLDFNTVSVSSAANRVVTVQNGGTEALTLSNVSVEGEGVTAALPEEIEIPSGAVYSVLVRFEPPGEGDYSGVLKIDCDDPASPTFAIPLVGRAAGQARVDVTPQELIVTILEGTEGEESFDISNTGNGSLDWRVFDSNSEFGPYPEIAERDDPKLDALWGMGSVEQGGIEARRAWSITEGDPAVIVAVIDTGADLDHPDLAAAWWVNEGEIAGNGIDDDENGYVDDVTGWNFMGKNADVDDLQGHGTHVAGTIGAIGNNGIGVAGVASGVRLLPLKFLEDSGSVFDAISAIKYAEKYGAKVINASWGSEGRSLQLKQAIAEYVEATGGVFVAAAGNESVDTDQSPRFPACYSDEGIVAVAASDGLSNLCGFSNYGAKTVDLAAPGELILSTYLGGDYAYKSGTSMATPHVAGVAALLYSSNPDFGPEIVKTILLSEVDSVPSLAEVLVSSGRLNALTYFLRISLDWIDVDPRSGQVAPLERETVTLRVDARALQPGVYAAQLAFVNRVSELADFELFELPIEVRVISKDAQSQWAMEQFGSGNLLYTKESLGVWAEDANPDGDAYPNYVERLLGSSPSVADRGLIRIVVAEGHNPSLVYQFGRQFSEDPWLVEWSSDLSPGSWQRDFLVEVVQRELGPMIQREVTLEGETPEKRLFYRIVPKAAGE